MSMETELKLEDIKPINNLILVELVMEEDADDSSKSKEVTTDSGIVIEAPSEDRINHQQQQETIKCCEVIAVSDKVKLEYGIDAGSKVLVHKFKGQSFLIDDHAYLLLDISTSNEVYAIVG